MRHGETEWNALGRLQGRTDIPLNSNGISQAEECREYLKEDHWDAVITSPLKRAKQTAEIINQDIEAPFFVMDEFIERCFGDVEGMTLSDRKSKYPNRNYPNQEEQHIFMKRILAGLEKINKEFKNQKVLLVAHGAVIYSILETLSKGEVDLENTRLFNACISNLHFRENEWRVKSYNQVSHLKQRNRGQA